MTGRRIRLQGTVQGVGFRPWVYRVARDAAVTGRVRNDSSGVTIEAFGPAAALDAFVDPLPPLPAPAPRSPACVGRPPHTTARPAAAVVARVLEEPIAYEHAPAFSIDASAETGEQHV